MGFLLKLKAAAWTFVFLNKTPLRFGPPPEPRELTERGGHFNPEHINNPGYQCLLDTGQVRCVCTANANHEYIKWALYKSSLIKVKKSLKISFFQTCIQMSESGFSAAPELKLWIMLEWAWENSRRIYHKLEVNDGSNMQQMPNWKKENNYTCRKQDSRTFGDTGVDVISTEEFIRIQIVC